MAFLDQTKVWVGLQYGDETRTYTRTQIVFTDEDRATTWALEWPERRETFSAGFIQGKQRL